MPQIRLERVSKYYPQDKKQMAAVQEINLTVEQGEFLFLTGSSGAGKSTLLQLISGDLRPTSGAVFLDDINLTRLSRLAATACAWFSAAYLSSHSSCGNGPSPKIYPQSPC